MIGLRREKHDVEAEAVAVGVDVQLRVLALSRQFHGVERHGSSQSAICHRHTQRATEVRLHLGVVLVLAIASRGANPCSREVAPQFDGPASGWPHDIGRVVIDALVALCKDGVACMQQLVIRHQSLAQGVVFFLVHAPAVSSSPQDTVAPLQQASLVRGPSDLQSDAVGIFHLLLPAALLLAALGLGRSIDGDGCHEEQDHPADEKADGKAGGVER